MIRRPLRRGLPAAALLCLWHVACTGPYSEQKVAAKGDSPAVPVATIRLTTGHVPEMITANGELFAEEQANISTKVPGRVTRLSVDLGSQVQAGDVLAELERDDYEFRVKQAEALVEQTRARLALANSKDDKVDPERTAMVKEARAALEEARVVFDTTERLQKEGVVSRVEYERALARKQGLEARVQSSLPKSSPWARNSPNAARSFRWPASSCRTAPSARPSPAPLPAASPPR